MVGQPTLRADAFAEGTLPRSNGELIFDHPWQARVLAMTVLFVERTGRRWDDFRRPLVDAIGEMPERTYWESWLIALESLAAETESRKGLSLPPPKPLPGSQIDH